MVWLSRPLLITVKKSILLLVKLIFSVFIQVQTKYDEVRVASLQPATAARKLFGTPEDRIDAKREGLVASRESQVQDGNISEDLKRFKDKIDSRL